MSEKKKIDRLFQEKFKDYEVFPDPEVWKNIQNNLMKKKKRRIVPLWLRFAGAAAILLLLVASYFWKYADAGINNQDIPNEIITNTDIKESAREIIKDPVINTTITQENQPTVSENQSIVSATKGSASNQNGSSLANTKESNQSEIVLSESSVNPIVTHVTEEGVSTEKINLMSGEFAINTPIEEQKNLPTYKGKQMDLQEAITEEEVAKNIPENTKKWSIGSMVAPVYYNSLSNGSPIDAALATNDKDPVASLSYGLKVNYKINNKLSIQSGINALELGYTTENVATLISSSLLNNSSSNIKTNAEGVSIEAISTQQQLNETYSARTSFDTNGSLNQSLGYIELPMEAKYALVEKRLGVNVIGGFSTYVLYQNKIHQTSFGKTTLLGEASNLNTLNFSGNLGFDLDYNLSKKIYINVSPMFKYQFNTFSESSGGFQPYFFGVYTGLNFRF